ncbi:MAG TPA: 30S ribosome-binding factor RbfA [Planctomycetota bacterium]|nr:30S ribosome-binding factor RbfA [Planctomycetota bacterium]
MKLRIERLKELIRETAAEVILHELTDPRIGFCTVTQVQLADDLSHCTIHVSVLGDDKVKALTMHGLQNARGVIQRRIAGQMKTRTTPHVKLELDESIEKNFAVMAKIKQARESDSDAGKGSAEPSKNNKNISDNVDLSFDDDEC